MAWRFRTPSRVRGRCQRVRPLNKRARSFLSCSKQPCSQGGRVRVGKNALYMCRGAGARFLVSHSYEVAARLRLHDDRARTNTYSTLELGPSPNAAALARGWLVAATKAPNTRCYCCGRPWERNGAFWSENTRKEPSFVQRCEIRQFGMMPLMAESTASPRPYCVGSHASRRVSEHSRHRLHHQGCELAFT